MTRVLILGGGGFIGGRVPTALTHLGHEAVTASRRTGVDRNDAAAVARFAGAQKCDVLIDMIAFEPESTVALHDALSGVVSSYVLVSSADVYRNYGGLHRLETPAPIAEPMTEEAPRRTRLYPYRTTPPRAADDPDVRLDRYDKIPIEDALAGPRTTIVRLPMVYGPGDRQSRFGWMIERMRKNASRLVAPEAWLNWRSTYGHVEDVAHALALAATHPAAGGRVYHCGETPIPHWAWARRFAALISWRGDIVAEGQPAGPLAGLDLSYPLALDTGRIRRELGFAEVVAPAQALQSVLDADAAR